MKGCQNWLLEQFAKLWASLPWEFKSPTFLQKNSQLVSVMVSTIVSKTIRLSSILRRFAKYGIIAKLVQQLSTDGYVLVRVQLIPNSRVLTTCIAYINTNPISKIAYARILTTLGICEISQCPYLIMSRYVLYMGFMLDLMASGCDGQRKNLSFDEWAI